MLDIKVTKTTAPKAKPDEKHLGFGNHYTDHMFIMDYIFDKLNTTIQPIRNIRQYLRTVLFHAPSTCTHDYDARVRWDFYGQNQSIRS